MKKFLCLVCMVAALFGVVACGIGDTNTTYNRSEIGRAGKVAYGRISAMTQVEIAGESEGGTLVGAGVGGLAGGIAGSTVGRGAGSSLMALGGATVGALAGGAIGGAAAQAATKDTAYEFIVRLDNGEDTFFTQTNELGLRPGDRVVLVQLNGKWRIRAKQ